MHVDMKKLLIIILILTVALPLTGDELSIQIRVNSPIPLLEIGNIPLRSDLKNVQGYNPDPEGFLRHEGKYSVDRIDTPSKGKASMKKWELYFYPNGNFLIKSSGTKGYKKIEPEAKCGFYKVVDSTLVKVNMYIMNYENKMRSMYTDYYRIVNDTTVQPIVHVDFRGRNGESEDRDLYHFVNDTLPRFDNPILLYKWMHTSAEQKEE